MDNLKKYNFKNYLSHPEDYPLNEDLLKITASDEFNNQIGLALFLVSYNQKSIKPLEIGIDNDHRRKGVATRIYMLAEEISGFKMIPSDDASDEAVLFWSQKNRPFGN